MTDVNQIITEHLDIWTSAIEKKSSAGRGSGGGVSLYGLKKLRDLILELGVRGRLVPQFDHEGTGEELLKRILQQRKTLEKNKQVRPKSAGSRSSNHWPFRLPDSWTWATLSQTSDFRPGKTPSTKNATYWSSEGQGYPWVSISDLVANGSVSSTAKEVSETAHRDVFKGALVPAGTLLMSFKLTIGKTSFLDIDAFHNEAIIGINPLEGVSKDYLFRFLPLLSSFASDKAAIKGNTLNAGSLSVLPVPLPPLAEQHRIVSKVDELLGLCDALERQTEDSLKAHQTLVETCLATLANSQSPEDLTQNWTRIEAHFDTLFTTEESVKALEEVILQLGVSGLLGTGNPADEAADSILKEIGRRNPKAKNGKRSRLRGQVSLNQSNGLDGELPRGWELVEFAELIEPSKPISYGVLVPGKDTDGGVPFVRIADLSIDSPAELPDKSISQKVDEQYARTRLEGGEILMGVVGSIGKLGVAPDSWRGANIARAVCRIVPAQELSKNFVLLLLRSRLMQERFRGDTRVLAQPTLNIGLIRSAPTPLPPLAEQNRIVERVEELLKVSARLRSLIESSQSTSLLLADTLTSKIH